MTEEGRSRSQLALLVIATAMGLMLLVLTVATALSQNLYGFEVDLEAIDLETGELAWNRSYIVESGPEILENRVIVVAPDGLKAIGEHGTVEWETNLPRAGYVVGTQTAVFTGTLDDGLPAVVALVPETGEVMWRFDGTHLDDEVDGTGAPDRLWLVGASNTLAVLTDSSRYWVVNATSGEFVAKIAPLRGELHVGDDAVVFLAEDRLAAVGLDGIERTLLEQVPRSTRINGIRDGAVVINEAGTGSGRILHAHDTTTGAELWRQAIKGYRATQQEGEFLVVYRSSGIALVEYPTGVLAPGPPWTVAKTASGQSMAAAVVRELAESPDSTRYLTSGDDTIAVDSDTGQVRWTRPNQKPIAAASGVAIITSRTRLTVVAEQSGETLSKVKRGKRSYAAAVEDRALIVNGGSVELTSAAGTTTILAQLRPGARIGGLSARYAVVYEGTGDDGRTRHLIVWDIVTGDKVVDDVFDGFFAVDLNGESVVLSQRGKRTDIDLSDGSVRQGDPLPYRPHEPPPTSPVVVAFDVTLTRMLWAQEAAEESRIGIVGTNLIVSTMGYKHR